jgi:iron complex outermembrane recepter protein
MSERIAEVHQSTFLSAMRGSRLKALALAGCLSLAMSAGAQAPAAAAADSPAQASAQQKPERVTTTVVVHGETKDDYLPESVSVGTLDGATLQQTPLSATVVTRDLLNDQVARVLSDVVKNDASIGEDYAPVGYYGNYEIRGFAIDLATGLQINGMTIAGEQDVPLENKQSVEFLKGIAGVESGVSSAGGLINYITKRPAAIKAVDVATDHRGSAFGAVDLGHLFGGRKQVGARVNLAGERMMSYVNGADGWRAMGAGAADWKLSSKAVLTGNFEYQHKVQRSVSGYQLLGGDTLPDIDRIYPSTMLGQQSWEKPNTFDTFNTGARLDYDLPRAWRAFASASYSHSLIDDNVVYAYGCGSQEACVSGGGTAPDYFFAPDGGYDIYDYRNPGELRINGQAEAMIVGHVRTGPIEHDLAAGGVAYTRSFQQPSSSVYDYVGSENIYEPNQAFPIEIIPDTGKPDQAGPRVLNEDNHQTALVIQDRVHLPGHVQLLAGGRYNSVRDHNFGGGSTTDRKVWLPQYAATYNPVASVTLYGNYGVMLSLGPQAPWWAGGYYLDPFTTRQAEVGAKFQPGQRILLTAAFFHMRAPFFYPKVVDEAGDLEFVSEGRETHDGIEVSAEGKAASWLRLSGSAAAIRAQSSNTGTPAFDNKQVLNVPHLRTTLFADMLLPHAHGLHLMPGWSYTGRKEASRDDAVSVNGYNLFSMGASYTPGGEQGRMTVRIYADNIADKRYWKDTGASYGDTFVHLGAPTTVRLSAHYTF